MAVDLSKLILYSQAPAFKNNVMISGSKAITGSLALGTNTRTYNITLPKDADIVDVIFKGPVLSSASRRSANAWFKDDYIAVSITAGGPPLVARLSWKMTSARNLQLVATIQNPYNFTSSMISTTFYYRIVDYSASSV